MDRAVVPTDRGTALTDRARNGIQRGRRFNSRPTLSTALKKSGLERLNSGMMNPFSWSREHQLALLVAALIGAALATVLGYIV
jgi:hypothetical protein